jgi:hypothetical protein
MNDFLKKDIVFDLDKVGDRIGSNGINTNAGVFAGMYSNFFIGERWGFGVFSGADGLIHANLPQSLFKLISEGNVNPRSSGTISAYGGVFANVGLSGYGQFDKLRVGVKPALFSPLVYIPGKSGINYDLQTIKDDKGEEYLYLNADGEIVIYSPFLENGKMQFGMDVSVEAEYALFSFLDLGAEISSIPIYRAAVKNGTRYYLKEIDLKVENPMTGDPPEFPEIEFVSDDKYTKLLNVYRPFRLDAYALYRPFNFDLFTIAFRPNIGFTSLVTESKSYFNAGLEAQFGFFQKMLMLNIGTGRIDNIWKHSLGFILNFRAVQFHLGADLRSQNLAGSFQGRGFGFNMGFVFGF